MAFCVEKNAEARIHFERKKTLDHSEYKVARVIAVHKERYQLMMDEETCFAHLKDSVYYHQCAMPYPTAGDFVRCLPNPYGDALILETLPRKTFFQRFDAFSAGRDSQAIAANFDTVLILTSANHDFNEKRLHRYLIAARQSSAVYAILVTKADAAENAEEYLLKAKSAAGDCPVHLVSAVTGQGLDAVRPYLRPGSVTVFLGSSGVGKSTLVNALAGRVVMDTNGIREDDSKGRHTTTRRQIISLDDGAMIMDTPGMRELGLIDAEDGLGDTFGDIGRIAAQCHFANCTHAHEPGCAVQAALEAGEITLAAWQEYQALQKEARRKTRQGQMERTQRQKAISKFSRQFKGGRGGKEPY